VADAYVKTFLVDETFVMEDDNNGPEIMAFQLPSDTLGDMYLWGGNFEYDTELTTPGLYTWVASAPLDGNGDFIDNMYSTAGVLYVVTNFSTYNDPTQVRLKGQVQVAYLPVVESPAP
jgi:hypothetical protein